MATFGDRLIRAREQRGWTQQELAARAGIRYETISRIEHGAHKEPRVYVAVALAKALGTTVDYLVGMYEDDEHTRETPSAGAPPAAHWQGRPITVRDVTADEAPPAEKQKPKRQRTRKAAPVA